MHNILVTGGTGMVGKHLQEILPNATYIGSEIDLKDPIVTDALFNKLKPAQVIHLAAKVGGIQENIAKPADFFDDDILINTNILRSSLKHGTKRFTGVLSTCAYPDKVESYPMKEEDLYTGPPAPTNFSYGYAKRCMAVQIDAYNKQHGTKYNYIIPCNLYSEYDNFDNKGKAHFVTALLQKIVNAENNTLSLLGTGKPLRQFMHAGDLAKIIKLMIDNNIYDNFNVSTKENLSIDYMARIALEVTENNYEIEYTNNVDGQFRKDVCSSKLCETFPDFEFTPFKEGIKKVYEIMKYGNNN